MAQETQRNPKTFKQKQGRKKMASNRLRMDQKNKE